MKTYSRKKLGDNEQEIIIDLNDVCRLCMNNEDELISIYNNDEPIPLTLRIMACVALEVFEGDGLPDKICKSCHLQLEKSYVFRKKCESSDMKLRQHLREIKQLHDDNERIMEIEEASEIDMSQAGPSSEEDLVGVTKVTYIQQDHDVEDDPENITLPQPTDDSVREACTIKTDDENDILRDKDHPETESGSIYVMPEEESNELEGHNMDAIADVVKATLANQTGLNISGELQMRISQSTDNSTQVEVTTEDGSVIVMELMAEEDAEELVEPIISRASEPGELNVFQCPVCPKSFPRKIQLKRHASVHLVQRGFSCGICEKWFPTRSALVRHERIHTGERPFQCEVCQKSFAQKEILFRHLMTHSGQKPYNCPHCDKGFSQKETLRIHIRTHAAPGAAASDVQLHYCSLCPKVFCHASGLSRHLLTHTGKTFKCGYCDKSFTDKSSLRRHQLQTNHEI